MMKIGANEIRFVFDHAQQFYYLAAATGFLIAGIWATFTWRIQHRLRLRELFPGIEASFKVVSFPPQGGCVYLQIETVWRNTGTHPIYVDASKCYARIFHVPDSQKVGFFTALDLGAPSHEINPLKGRDGYVLEPKTDSTVKIFVSLPAEKLYFFQVGVARLTKVEWTWKINFLVSTAEEVNEVPKDERNGRVSPSRDLK